MKIDVGIINYNGGSELLGCVRSLKSQTVPLRVFVFDNASTDNSIQVLKDSGMDCVVIESQKNLGYAGACNGLLDNMESEIQVLCNMDLEFSPDWAKNLLDCFERHPEVGSVASLVMEKSGVVNAVGVLFGADLFAKNEARGLNISEADIREFLKRDIKSAGLKSKHVRKVNMNRDLRNLRKNHFSILIWILR